MTPEILQDKEDQEDPESQLKSKRAKTKEKETSRMSNDNIVRNFNQDNTSENIEMKDTDKAKQIGTVINNEELSEFSFNGGQN